MPNSAASLSSQQAALSGVEHLADESDACRAKDDLNWALVDTPPPHGARGSNRNQAFQPPRNSGFWEGARLTDKLQAGSIGRFHNAMRKLEGIVDLADFKLPRLVVIGNQNRGKSSLLESITKCPIFPRGDDTTTRAPVCLRLQHVPLAMDSIQVSWKNQRTQQPRTKKLMQLSEISGVVEGIMNEISPDRIAADEIVVHICSPSMMNLEFIDLPGIVAAPAAKQQQTEELVNKYLQHRETLVICVEEATCGNLDGGQVLGLVQRAQKSRHTIVALTKCDNLAPPEIRKRLLLRLLRSSNEITDRKQKDTDFAGCVAVINRSHHDVKTLLEAGDEEQSTFETQVFSKRPDMPQQFAAQPPAIQDNLGIANLISQVEAMYRGFVLKDWKQTALQQLDPIMKHVDQQIDALGPDPKHLPISRVMHAVQDQIDFDNTLGPMVDDSVQLISVHLETPSPRGNHVSTAKIPLRSLADIKPVPQDIARAVQLKDITHSTMAAIDTWLKEARYLESVCKVVSGVFENGKSTSLRLDRFDSLKEEIVLRGLRRVIPIEQIRNSIIQDLQPMAGLLRLGLWADRELGRPPWEIMGEAAMLGVAQEVLHPLQTTALLSCVPDSFQLAENAAAQRARTQLEERRQNLKHAQDVIMNIKQELDGPKSGMSWDTRHAGYVEDFKFCSSRAWSQEICPYNSHFVYALDNKLCLHKEALRACHSS